MGGASKTTQSLKRIGQWIVYALFRCVEAVLRELPLVLIWWIGRGLGIVAYFVSGKYRKLALHNLRIAFGREKSEAASHARISRAFLLISSAASSFLL